MPKAELSREDQDKYVELLKELVKTSRREAFESFCWRLKHLTPKPIAKRKPGRPPSKVRRDAFIRERVMRQFDKYMNYSLRALTEGAYDVAGVRLGVGLHEERFYQAFRMIEGAPDSPPISSDEGFYFNLGAIFAITMARSMVLTLVVEDLDRLQNIRKHVEFAREHAKEMTPLLKARGISQEGIEIIRREAVADLPNDTVRKLRESVIPRKDITLLTLTLKEWEGTTYKGEVLARLGWSEEKLMQVITEARRQGIGISIERGEKGEFLLIA